MDTVFDKRNMYPRARSTLSHFSDILWANLPKENVEMEAINVNWLRFSNSDNVRGWWVSKEMFLIFIS